MARIPVVTRTFTITKASVLVADTQTQEVIKTEVILPRVYKEEKKLNEACRNAVEADSTTIKFVTCLSTETVKELRSMSEQDFIRYSVAVHPKNTQNNN